MAYLLGAAGDACIFHRPSKGEYGIEYEQKNRSWLDLSIRPRVHSVFGRLIPVHRRKTGLYRLRLYSKGAYGIFRHVWDNPDVILDWPASAQIEFVRGFFDAEGSAPRREPGTGWRLSIYQKDRRKLRIIHEILRRNGIQAGRLTNSRDIGLLPIRTQANVERFWRTFEPEHPDKRAAISSLFAHSAL